MGSDDRSDGGPVDKSLPGEFRLLQGGNFNVGVGSSSGTRAHVLSIAVTEEGVATSGGLVSITGLALGGIPYYAFQVAAQGAANQLATNQLVVDYPVPLISDVGGTVYLKVPAYPSAAVVCGTILAAKY
jgi:hypothetical protein